MEMQTNETAQTRTGNTSAEQPTQSTPSISAQRRSNTFPLPNKKEIRRFARQLNRTLTSLSIIAALASTAVEKTSENDSATLRINTLGIQVGQAKLPANPSTDFQYKGIATEVMEAVADRAAQYLGTDAKSEDMFNGKGKETVKKVGGAIIHRMIAPLPLERE